MEQIWDYLAILAKTLHLSFLATMCVSHKQEQDSRAMGLDYLGDNMPHVFLNSLNKFEEGK